MSHERERRDPEAGQPLASFSSGTTHAVTQWAARGEELARRRPIAIVLALLVVLYGARWAGKKMGDFEVYHRAAKRAVAGETTYRLSDPHRYLYAPIVTFLFFPIAVLPKTLGKVLWLALNFAAVASVLKTSGELVYRGTRAPPGFYVLLFLLTGRFVDNNVGHGQINLLLIWLVLQAYAQADRRHYARAGFALAAAISAKIVPVVFLGQMVLARRFRFAAWTVGAFAVLMTIPVVWWGGDYPAVLRDWVAVVVDQAGHYDVGNKINQSISAFSHRVFALGEGEPSSGAIALTAALHATFLAALAATSLRVARAGAAASPLLRCDELALWLLYSTFAAPYSWKYYYANLAFPFAVALARLWTDRWRRFAIVLGVVLALNTIAGIELPGESAEAMLDACSLHFVGAALLFVLLEREVARATAAVSAEPRPAIP